jgi:hypothetical protein
MGRARIGPGVTGVGGATGRRLSGGVAEVVVGESGVAGAVATIEGALVGVPSAAGGVVLVGTGIRFGDVVHAMRVARLEAPKVSARRRITDSFRGPH